MGRQTNGPVHNAEPGAGSSLPGGGGRLCLSQLFRHGRARAPQSAHLLRPSPAAAAGICSSTAQSALRMHTDIAQGQKPVGVRAESPTRIFLMTEPGEERLRLRILPSLAPSVLAVWLWENHYASLNLSFFSPKRCIIKSPFWDCGRGQMRRALFARRLRAPLSPLLTLPFDGDSGPPGPDGNASWLSGLWVGGRARELEGRGRGGSRRPFPLLPQGHQ